MQSNYWFPAKRYGWGWGFPTVWQGQATLVGFILMLVAGSFVFPRRTRTGASWPMWR